MIPRSPAALQPLPKRPWQQAMQEAVTGVDELLRMLGLDPAAVPVQAVAGDFPLRVPRSYVARMRRGDPEDPLLRQVLPLAEEIVAQAGFGLDAVGDLASLRGEGLLHKYQGRALLIATGACAVHCRYCFRRHFPYPDNNAARDGWRGALEALRADTSISEVILSGGDPLSLSDRRLAELSRELDAIPQLKRLRIHTRQPIMLPERVDDALLGWLGHGRLQRVLVVHANHPQELDADVAAALRRLGARGVTLLNQSVLLRGVNDRLPVLAELSERLFECGVMPYYLHLLDRVRGAAHFEVPASEAASLMRQLAACLPGYLVPKLVTEIAGLPYKQPAFW